jgi:type IV pilus assembly protein PilN
MIKINLLQAKKEKKKAGLKKELAVLILAVVLLVALLGFLQWQMDKKTEETQVKIAGLKKEIASAKSLMTDLNKAKEDQRILQDKLNIINSLRKEKSLPAKILDALSTDKPEKVQLETLKKEGAKLSIEGIALDDETIANFMTNLRKSKLFRNIDLIVSEQTEQGKIKLKKFSLTCEIVSM